MQRAEIAVLSRHASPQDRDNYSNRALDRIAAITTRLGATGNKDQSVRLSAWMRAGVAVAVIRQASAQLGGAMRPAAEALQTTGRKEVNKEKPSATVLARSDQAIPVAGKTTRPAPPTPTRA